MKSPPASSAAISEQEKSIRKSLVEKAKHDLEKLSTMPGQIEKT